MMHSSRKALLAVLSIFLLAGSSLQVPGTVVENEEEYETYEPMSLEGFRQEFQRPESTMPEVVELRNYFKSVDDSIAVHAYEQCLTDLVMLKYKDHEEVSEKDFKVHRKHTEFHVKEYIFEKNFRSTYHLSDVYHDYF